MRRFLKIFSYTFYFISLDFVTGSKFSVDAEVGHATVEEGIPDGWMGLDVGEKSVEDFITAINRAKIIVWNG